MWRCSCDVCADTGYDMIDNGYENWFVAKISGTSARVAVQSAGHGTLLAVPEFRMTESIGLLPVKQALPPGMVSGGLAESAAQLYQALRLLHSLQTRPAAVLSTALEARLATIPETDRTREVRQRIGQDLFREALMELWEGRCALSGAKLPPALLRASHAKPWALSSDDERLDPFNGLLLAVLWRALRSRSDCVCQRWNGPIGLGRYLRGL
jgi:putative restriction endonuclease